MCGCRVVVLVGVEVVVAGWGGGVEVVVGVLGSRGWLGWWGWSGWTGWV